MWHAARRTSKDRGLEVGPDLAVDPDKALGPVADRVGSRLGSRLALLSRLASIALVVILLAVSGFAVAFSHATFEAADAANVANTLSDSYADAAAAVAAEESLERKYRLEPGPEVRARYDAASAQLLDALALVARDGGPSDRTLVAKVTATHRTYLRAIERMYAAVDKGDAAAVLRIDSGEVDPLFGSIAQTVDVAADAKHAEEQALQQQQQQLQSLTGVLTPTVFLVGLLFAALLTVDFRTVECEPCRPPRLLRVST